MTLTGITDDVIRSLLRTTRSRPLEGLHENADSWRLGTFGILKHQPCWNNGWTFDLLPEARFYKRWFELPDLGAKGWAIIFRIFDPAGEPTKNYEQFPGWVPPEREREADQWIALLNAEIRARLREAGKVS